jgi:hypothetical protein
MVIVKDFVVFSGEGVVFQQKEIVVLDQFIETTGEFLVLLVGYAVL